MSEMESMIGKPARRAWREYNKGKNPKDFVPFKNFIEDYKQKVSADGVNENLVLVDRSLNDTVQKAIKDAVKTGGYKTKASDKTVFGINKTVFIVGSVLFTGGLIYLITRIAKK